MCLGLAEQVSSVDHAEFSDADLLPIESIAATLRRELNTLKLSNSTEIIEVDLSDMHLLIVSLREPGVHQQCPPLNHIIVRLYCHGVPFRLRFALSLVTLSGVYLVESNEEEQTWYSRSQMENQECGLSITETFRDYFTDFKS
ncbi:hypothetical protein AHF37_02991 [Paragonimus kellicotti]|nr:hypothetical protein AHF37_02991 [Paragonimus kellicotti]